MLSIVVVYTASSWYGVRVMTVLVDFEREAQLVRDVFYGGDAGAKLAIEYQGEIWMMKLPKSTKSYRVRQMSYTTSPLSEFLGSQIYRLVGIPVHETILGVYRGKVVVACKDFTFEHGREIGRLIPFNEIKNAFMSSDIESYSGSGSETLLEEVLATVKNQPTLQAVPGVMERFWDMFVVDALIGNNDRNNGNWGLFRSYQGGMVGLAPVFDNGNAFFSKRGIEQMVTRLHDDAAIREDAYRAPTCVYKYVGYDNEPHKINPYTFISRADESDCNQALVRLMDRLNLAQVEELIQEIPTEYGDIRVMPSEQKEFYTRIVQVRMNDIFEPTWRALVDTPYREIGGKSSLRAEINRRASEAIGMPRPDEGRGLSPRHHL